MTVIGGLYDGAQATPARGLRTNVNGLAAVAAPATAGVRDLLAGAVPGLRARVPGARGLPGGASGVG